MFTPKTKAGGGYDVLRHSGKRGQRSRQRMVKTAAYAETARAKSMRLITQLRLVGILAGIALILPGCAFFFTDGERSIGMIPRTPGSNVVFRTTLRGDTMGISFRCPASASTTAGTDRVRVTLSNLSEDKRINVTPKAPGRRIAVEPGASVCLYEGSLAELMNGQGKGVREGGFGVRTESGRISCRLEIQFPSVPTLTDPIQVVAYYSSTPL